MKKFIALILAILTIILLCACGSPDTNDTETTANTTDKTTAAVTEPPVAYNTMDISDFSIVYSDLSSAPLANAVKDAIKKKTGAELSLIKETKAAEYELIVGTVQRDVNKSYFENAFNTSDKYGIMVDGKKIFLVGFSDDITKESVNYFTDTYLKDGSTTFEIEDKAEIFIQVDLKKLQIPAKEGENTLRFLTNNILKQELRSNAARADGILKAYAIVKPDVVALQECDDLWFTKTRFLENMKLLGYELVISDDRVNTPLLYNTATLKLIESGFNSYDATDKIGKFRTYQWALLEQISTGKRFIAASTHLIANGSVPATSSGSSLRTQSASQAARELVELSKKYNAPIIFGGDFNSGGASSAYSVLRAKFSSARNDCDSKKNMTYATSLGAGGVVVEGDLNSAIDHVFYSKTGVKAIHFETLLAPFTYTFTDHLAVSFDFTLE